MNIGMPNLGPVNNIMGNANNAFDKLSSQNPIPGSFSGVRNAWDTGFGKFQDWTRSAPGQAHDEWMHMTGNDPWNFGREAVPAAVGMGMGGFNPLSPFGISGGINSAQYANWASHDKFMKNLEAYKAMQGRNSAAGSAGASGISGSVVGAQSNEAASNAMAPYAAMRRAAMMSYQNDIMDQITGWLSMMGYGGQMYGGYSR